jgi:hypothetical protein
MIRRLLGTAVLLGVVLLLILSACQPGATSTPLTSAPTSFTPASTPTASPPSTTTPRTPLPTVSAPAANTTAAADIGVYSDVYQNQLVSGFEWGRLLPGASATMVVYLKDLGSQDVTVKVSDTGLAGGFALTGDTLTISPGLTSKGTAKVFQLALTLTAAADAATGDCKFTTDFNNVNIPSHVLVGAATSSNTTSTPAPALKLSSIEVTPSSTANLTLGFTQQFTAIGIYSDGSKANITTKATWTSSDKNIATIASAGSAFAGLAASVAKGNTSITASVAGVTSQPTLLVVVIQPTLSSIQVTPAAPPNLLVGSTLQFSAVGTYSDGSQVNITNLVDWSSSDARVASISSLGLATGATAGSASISASLSTKYQPTVSSLPAVLTIVSPGVY